MSDAGAGRARQSRAQAPKSAGRPATGATGRRPRAIRPREAALLEQLAQGPRTLIHGPVGTCLKKGWIEHTEVEDDLDKVIKGGKANRLKRPCYQLTASGFQQLSNAPDFRVGDDGAGLPKG
jgi:hypothetical protein